MRNNVMFAAALALSGTMISGCAATYGQKIEADKVSQIVKGKTTRDELVSWFGQPMQTVMMPDGGRTMYFVYYRSSGADYYKQLAATAVGKGKAQTGTNLSVVINSDGIVTDYEYSAGSQ